MEISTFRKSDVVCLKIDDNFFDIKSYQQPLLRRRRQFENLYQKYGLYSLPDGGESRT